MKNLLLLSCVTAGVVACMTSSHKETASPLGQQALQSGIDRSNFDPQVSPQDNFYQFVNGTWLKKTQIPADKSNYGIFTILDENTRDRLKVIIGELEKNQSHPQGSDEQKIRDLYKSFLNTQEIEKRGISTLAAELGAIDRIASRRELAAYFARAGRMGTGAPFGIYVNIDHKDPNRYVVFVAQSGLGLPDRDHYLNPSDKSRRLRAAYQQHVQKMLTLAGLKNPDRAAKTILKLETSLAGMQWTRAELRDSEKTYNPYSTQKVRQLLGHFAWDEYVRSAATPQQDFFVVETPSYLQRFNQLYHQTKLDEWKTYFKWHLLTTHASYLNKAFDDENFAFYGSRLRGIKQQEERWKRGVKVVDSVLGELLGKEYVKRHFRPEAKQHMEQMVENLRAAYRQSIEELDWMGPATKKRAIEKLGKFTPKIGYPKKWRDYAGLRVSAGDLMDNIVRSYEFEYQFMIGKLGKPIDRDEWLMNPHEVNAYYSASRNEIVFPAAILQPPFFNREAEDAVNYGAIGAVIGHEMGHGFDDQGAKFNGEGAMVDWWTKDDFKEFQKRAQKLADQSARYEPLAGHKLNGQLTLGENIGDLGGLSIAYRAYQLSPAGKKSPLIDGYTGEQRFFIGWGQIWARKYTEEELVNRLLTDPHAPSEFRVNGIVRNMPQFYQAFEVKEGSRMFIPAAERVKIW